MPQFRKKPVVIEAFQYRENGSTPVPDWFCEVLAKGEALLPKPRQPLLCSSKHWKAK